MWKTTGIEAFINTIIGLDDKEKYDGIKDSITKHIQAINDQGAKYGWSNNVALIETTPGVYLSVYEYPGSIKKHRNHCEKDNGGDGPTFIWYLYNSSKGTKSAIFQYHQKN